MSEGDFLRSVRDRYWSQEQWRRVPAQFPETARGFKIQGGYRFDTPLCAGEIEGR